MKNVAPGNLFLKRLCLIFACQYYKVITMENIKESYLKRVEKYTSEVSRLKRRSTFFVFGKITFFMAFLFSIYSAYPRFTLSGIFLMVLTLAIYLFVYWLDVRCMSHIEHIRRKRAVCLDEISYLEGNFSIFSDGSDYIDITHEYSYDLDLFGPDSLFARINRSVTRRGERLLAYRLTHLINEREGIEFCRNAVEELKGLTDWRIDFHSQPFIEDHLQEMSQSIFKKRKMNGFFNPVIYSLSVMTTLLSLILGLAGVISMTLFGCMFFFQIITATILSRTISHSNMHAEKLKKEFRGYHYILDKISRQQFKSPKLNSLHDELFNSDNSSSKAFGELSGILNMFDQRNSEFSFILLNGLFLYDIYVTRRFNRWITRYLPHIGTWVECIAQFDMLSSFATYAYNNPSNVKAELIADEEGSDTLIEAKEMYHPFLWRKRPVANDFLLRRGNISIITGANMAGKSTFLRTVGVNYILACCGAPVSASSFRFTLVSLFSSMRTTDNLSKDISYFNAELIRLGQLLDHVKSHKHTLIILDEILKGTNSKDKLEGSVMFLNEISRHSVTGIIATHDLELSKLEQSACDIFTNYCFEIELSEEIKYSYKISRGVSKNMNATYLLRNILKRV